MCSNWTNLAARPALTGKANKMGYMPPPTTPTKAPLIRVQVGQFRSPAINVVPHYNAERSETLKELSRDFCKGVASNKKALSAHSKTPNEAKLNVLNLEMLNSW